MAKKKKNNNGNNNNSNDKINENNLNKENTEKEENSPEPTETTNTKIEEVAEETVDLEKTDSDTKDEKDDKKEETKPSKKKKNKPPLSSNKALVHGSIATIIIVSAVALFLVLNIFSDKVFNDKLKLEWDLTPTKKFTFTEESKKVLKDLKEDVTIYCLFDEEDVNDLQEQFKEGIKFLDKYEDFDKIKIVYTNPDKDPAIVSKIDPDDILENLQFGHIIVKSEKRMKQMTIENLMNTDAEQTGTYIMAAESQITNAINYVIMEEVPNIYFVEGHGEIPQDSGFTTKTDIAKTFGFEVDKVSLLTNEIPENADLLVFAAPQNDISSQEADKVTAFLKKGGNAIFYMDPIENTKKLDNFDKLLNMYNLQLEYDKVKENSADHHVAGENYIIVPEIQTHDITKYLTGNNMQVALINSRSIGQLKNQKESIVVTPLLKTSSEAVGESFEEGVADIKGPLTVGYAVEHNGFDKTSKIMVLGNSQVVFDQNIQQTNGAILLYGVYDWMQDEPTNIYVPSKESEVVQKNMSQTEAIVISILIIIVIPLLTIGTGTFIWFRRRHL